MAENCDGGGLTPARRQPVVAAHLDSENHSHLDCLAVADPDLALPPTARATPQREAVVAAICDLQGSWTALDVFDRARRRAPGLGLATVYRTLELLAREGSVRSLTGEGRPRYVRCHPGHHHHLVCVSCGAVEETELCAAPPAGELERRHGFSAESHEVDFYGRCARCAA
jgi:Fur family ferric uptake transcriptional regulator